MKILLTLLEPHYHMWGQFTLNKSSLSPKRDWGPKGVKRAFDVLFWMFIVRIPDTTGTTHTTYDSLYENAFYEKKEMPINEMVQRSCNKKRRIE